MSFLYNMMHPNKKRLVWRDAKMVISQPGDKKADDPNFMHIFYSVYRGVEEGTFFWYRSKLSGMPNVAVCSSIEDGVKQAEKDFKERYE